MPPPATSAPGGVTPSRHLCDELLDELAARLDTLLADRRLRGARSRLCREPWGAEHVGDPGILEPPVEIEVGVLAQRDVQREVVAAPAGLIQRVEHRLHLGEGQSRGHRSGVDPPIAQGGRSPEGGGRVAAAQYGYRPARPRVHLAERYVVVRAVVLDPSALPQGPQCRDHVVEALAASVEVLTGLDVLLLAPSDADPEVDPVVRQGGGGADRLRHRDEVSHRGDVDTGREGDRRGHGGQCRDEAHGVGPLRLLGPERRAVRRLGVGVPRRQLLRVEEVIGQVYALVAKAVCGRP